MGPAHLGWIIENVTGVPLLEFFEDRILGPLGMNDTSFNLPREKAPRLVSLRS
jgi:CubicO group peptidase (beta-lactamase class C family)